MFGTARFAALATPIQLDLDRLRMRSMRCLLVKETNSAFTVPA